MEKISENTDYRDSYDRDTKYWDGYYLSKSAPEQPSRFAEYAMQWMAEGKRLLDIGCGNGRDSIFFLNNGMIVTGVDASGKAISEACGRAEALSMIAKKEENNSNFSDVYKIKKNGSRKEYGRFITADFVSSEAIYSKKYDYCYSRFTIHAINEEQEDQLLNNVYAALKRKGLFFIEVRGVHDDIFGKGEKVSENAYIYDGHYRRFIVLSDLEKKLKELGFGIKYAAEERGFAPFGDDDPLVIRIVAEAVKGKR